MVLGCKSSDRLPATVTRPGFVGCLSCRWLPRVATISHPSAARSWRISRTFTTRARLRRRPNETVERLSDVRERVREEVAVGVQRDVDRSVAELRLEELRDARRRRPSARRRCGGGRGSGAVRGCARRTAGRKIRAMKLSLRQTAPCGVGKTRPRSFGARASSCSRRMRSASPERRTCRRPAGVLVGTSCPRALPPRPATTRRCEVDARSRRANSSPCRSPVRQAKRTRLPYGSTVSEASRSTSRQSRKRISARSRRGGLTRKMASSIVWPRSLRASQDHLERVEHQLRRRGACCATAETWSSTSAARISRAARRRRGRGA